MASRPVISESTFFGLWPFDGKSDVRKVRVEHIVIGIAFWIPCQSVTDRVFPFRVVSVTNANRQTVFPSRRSCPVRHCKATGPELAGSYWNSSKAFLGSCISASNNFCVRMFHEVVKHGPRVTWSFCTKVQSQEVVSYVAWLGVRLYSDVFRRVDKLAVFDVSWREPDDFSLAVSVCLELKKVLGPRKSPRP